MSELEFWSDEKAEAFVKEKEDKTQIQQELEAAIAKAKEFHPVTKLYVDGYTGEINRYKTPDNYVPDEGVFNDMPDLCHTEDHVSIAQMYARLKNMRALSIQDSEFDFDEDQVSADDLDDETISDMVSEVDDPSDYDNYINDAIQEQFGKDSEQKESDSAAKKQAVESKNEDKATEVAADE